MKTLLRLSGLMIFTSVFFIACQKEVSFEKGNVQVSVGSLAVDGTGNCLGTVVSGTYTKDTILKATNYVDISVQVDTAGTYTISSDTVNGYSFKASGTFSATGTQAVRLAGAGKPLSAGTNIFTVTYNGTTCTFSVTVTTGTGGSAVFLVNCTGAVAAGAYEVGTPLTAANTITLNVNVTTIGTWSISTAPAVNGITFSGSGTFATTGAQTIVLTGSGTPTAAGTFNFPVNAGTAPCSFSVVCTAPPDYFPRTTFSNWSYEYDGDPADSLLVYVIAPTVVKNGNTYNIFFYNDGTPPVDTFGYYRRASADYFEFGDLSYGVLDDPSYGEFIFLKDNQTVGSTWNSAQFSGPYTPTGGSTITVTLRWEMSILQQNVNVAVTSSAGTINYANTIEIKQELRQLVGSNWLLVGYFRCFYARDKGLIKQDFYDNTNSLQQESDVRRLAVY